MTSKPKLNQPDVETTTTIPNITIEKEKNLELAKQLGIDLTSLTPQPSKLEQCIKEWEDRGWTVDELKQFPVIKIWKLNKEQDVIDNIYVYPKKLNSTIDFNADYGTLNLLTKTLKALEEMKDGN